MVAGFPQSKHPREREGESKTKATVFCWRNLIISDVFCELEATQSLHPILNGRGLHEGINQEAGIIVSYNERLLSAKFWLLNLFVW